MITWVYIYFLLVPFGGCFNIPVGTDLNTVWGQDWPFSGINTYAHLPHKKCLLDTDIDFDVGIIGVPFDSTVSYRPGARFGPQGIRAASQRQFSLRGFNFRAGINPYQQWAKVLDCGDIPVTPMDSSLALKMMTAAFDNLLNRKSTNEPTTVPRLISLGGDHSIILPIIRNLYKIYGPITVLHFDSHLDTWSPGKYPSYWNSEASQFTHGSMLWMAKQEGLLSDHNIHAGLRTRLSGNDWQDYEDDDEYGFHRIESDEILKIGLDGIVDEIKHLLPKNSPIYISVDIDVLDPSAAPGTGTVEVGGWLTRELIHILRSLEDTMIVGADVVEVSPPFDQSDITSLAASQIVYELLTTMVKQGPIDSSLFQANIAAAGLEKEKNIIGGSFQQILKNRFQPENNDAMGGIGI